MRHQRDTLDRIIAKGRASAREAVAALLEARARDPQAADTTREVLRKLVETQSCLISAARLLERQP